MDSRRRCAFLTAGILLVLAASVIACAGPSDGEVSRSDRVRVVPPDNGHETDEGVAVKDQEVVAYAIEMTEVVSREPDPLAVRVAEILGTDARDTSDAMARMDSAESVGSLGAGAGGHAGERDADAASVGADGLSYQEYGNMLGAILGVDGELAAQALAQAIRDLHGVDFQAVSAGAEFTCGLRLDGSLMCWGNDEAAEEKGQLDVPREGTYVAVSSGWYGSCALRDDGRLKCWGRVDGGIKRFKRFKAFDTTASKTCGIQQDGSLMCWGRSVGDLSNEPEGSFVSLSNSGSWACAVRDDSTLACWGYRASEDWATVPAGTFQEVSTSPWGACGLRPSGDLECWAEPGPDGEKLLGHPPGPFTSIALGWTHGCGIRPDGRVECWGNDSLGEASPPDLRFQSLSANKDHTCGITVDQKVVCWGQSRYGPSP